MSSQSPSTAKNLERLSNTIIPLFVPPPATSTGPLLESFAAAHDELMEDDSLFTHRADFANAKVNLSAAARELQRTDTAREVHAEAVSSRKVTEVDVKTLLSNTRKGRLRSRLQNQSGSGTPGEETRESVLAEFAERKRVFDAEMAEAQERALSEFKKSLREHMLAEARTLG